MSSAKRRTSKVAPRGEAEVYKRSTHPIFTVSKILSVWDPRKILLNNSDFVHVLFLVEKKIEKNYLNYTLLYKSNFCPKTQHFHEIFTKKIDNFIED